MSAIEPTPKDAQREHEAAILETLPVPKWKNIPRAELYIYDFINDLEGASDARVKLYRETWSPALVGSLTIHREKETRFGIIDGRHRYLAVKSKPVMFHCAVFEGLTQEQVAALFLFHNEYRRNPSVSEKFHAAVLTGDPVARAVAHVIKQRGVGSELRAYSAALAVVGGAPSIPEGELALNAAMRILLASYPATDQRRLDSTLIRAVGRFITTYGNNPKLNVETLQKALTGNSKLTATQLKSIGTATGSSGMGASTAIFQHLENRYAQFAGGHRLERY